MLNPQKISRKRTKEEGWKEAANQSFATLRYVKINVATICLQSFLVLKTYSYLLNYELYFLNSR